MAIMLNSRTVIAAFVAIAGASAVMALKHRLAVNTALVAQAEANERAALASADASSNSGYHSYNHPRAGRASAPSVAHAATNESSGSRGNAMRARNDARNQAMYDALAAKISAENMTKLKALIDAKQHAMDDAFAAARDAGVDPGSARPVIDQIVAEARTRTDNEIKAELDPEAYAAYLAYVQSQPDDGGPPDGGPPPDDLMGGGPGGPPPDNR